jgi:hypothetical protein
MAHFAQLDKNNIVTQVIVVANAELLDENGVESEQRGVEFCQSLFGADTVWKQTSYNGNIRKRYAEVGFSYDATFDAFIKPKPQANPSFALDLVTLDWVPPVPRPTDTVYVWDESSVSWVAISQPYPSWMAQGDPLVWKPPVPRPTDGKPYRWDEASLSWVEVVQEPM